MLSESLLIEQLLLESNLDGGRNEALEKNGSARLNCRQYSTILESVQNLFLWNDDFSKRNIPRILFPIEEKILYLLSAVYTGKTTNAGE